MSKYRGNNPIGYTGTEESPHLPSDSLTGEGFRDVLLLPLPGLIVFICGSLVILGQTALPLVLRGGPLGSGSLFIRAVVELRAAPAPICAVLQL